MAGFVVIEETGYEGAWKFMILKAVIFAVLGIFCLAFPFAALNLSAYLLAFFLLIISVAALFSGFSAFGYFRKNWAMIILGVIGIALSIYSFVNPDFMVKFAAIVIGIIALVSGFSDIVMAFGQGLSAGIRVLTFVLGLITAVIGLVFLISPGLGAGVLVVVLGAGLVAGAVLSLIEGLMFRSVAKGHEVP
ncbi:MAG: DUF308 domain-containing protein [Methanocorpusculum sp.]|nr:DUF308 domain-containing protein [Methanocorpusculum sp.]